jgi:hypothetical protein
VPSPLPSPRRPVPVVARMLVLATAFVVIGATPAAADPAAPTDYRAEVTAVAPELPGVEASIRGGDAFLELQVEEGRAVAVEGYQGEPYLRFLEDGTVEQNLNSPTTYLNEDRTGAAPVPARADPDGDPEWEQVAGDGRYAWHDHRVHWMGAQPPTGVARGETIPTFDPWVVPVTIDGNPVEIQGTLTFAETVTPVPWFLLAIAAAVVLPLAGRPAAVPVAGAALVVVAALALLTGWSEFAVSPAGAGANPLLWGLPAVGLATAVAALLLHRRPAGPVAGLASVAVLAGWGLLRLSALLRPVLPSDLPDPLDRGSVALALGASLGAALLLVTAGALSLPTPDEEDETGPGASAAR